MPKSSIAIPFLLAGLLAGSPAAHAQVCGATVYANVSLAADLACPPGSDGLVIGADNLRVDLNGYAITTQHVWGTRGVRSAGFKGIKVVGPGRIENFSTGIALEGGTLHEVREVEVTSPTGTSIVLRDASGSIVEGNRGVAISVGSSPGLRADANVVAGNVAQTVWVEGCNTTNTEVSGNDLGGTVIFVSVGLLEGSTGTRVYGNRITAGSVYITGSSDNVVEANSVTNTPTQGYGFSGVVMSGGRSSCTGMTPVQAAYNRVSGNGISGGAFGVILGDGTFKNEVTNNKLYGAGTAGLLFRMGAEDNDARGNTINAPSLAVDQGRGNLWP